MADRLLDEFPPVSKQEWLDKVVSDLKGRPYEKLVRMSEAGIPIAPVYTAEDLPEGVERSFPGMDDLRRGESHLMNLGWGSWLVAQDYALSSLERWDAFKALIDGEPNGARGVRIILSNTLRKAYSKEPPTHSGGLVIENWSELEPILKWADEKGVVVYLEAGDAALDFLDSGLVGSFAGGVDLNPMLFFPEGDAGEDRLEDMLSLVARAFAHIKADPFFLLFTLTLQDLEAAGANAAQQIAYALAMANELVDRLGKYGIAPNDVFRVMGVQFPVTTDFFGEIAKLRAFRIVWGRVMEAWGLRNDAHGPYLQAVPAHSNETVADPHVNLLRHTTQAMSAAMGGCRMLSLPAFDAHFEESNLDSLRIARNIQLVLKHESYLGQVIDPTGGAYFVEQLTDALASKAWTLFQEIEVKGGWYQHVQSGDLSSSLLAGKQKRKSAVASGAKTILGTNHFPNEKEEIAVPSFPKSVGWSSNAILQRSRRLGASLEISHLPLELSRLSDAFEEVRLQVQQLKKANAGIERVLLLTFGDPTMRAARANFARNVLAAGGFVCTENGHPAQLELAMEGARTLNPRMVVLCGGDLDYLEKGAEWLNAIREHLPDAILILAGRPEGWEKLKECGIVEAIFAGMDRVQFLSRMVAALIERKEVVQ